MLLVVLLSACESKGQGRGWESRGFLYMTAFVSSPSPTSHQLPLANCTTNNQPNQGQCARPRCPIKGDRAPWGPPTLSASAPSRSKGGSSPTSRSATAAAHNPTLGQIMRLSLLMNNRNTLKAKRQCCSGVRGIAIYFKFETEWLPV